MKTFKKMHNPLLISFIDLLAVTITEPSPENIKKRIMFAVYQLGIEPTSFFFEISKSQNIPGYEKLREQLCDFEILSEKYPEKLFSEE